MKVKTLMNALEDMGENREVVVAVKVNANGGFIESFKSALGIAQSESYMISVHKIALSDEVVVIELGEPYEE